MKKTIFILLTALFAIGTMQADEQNRYMVIQKTNGETVKILTTDVANVTFEVDETPVIPEDPDVPTTVEEAKAMLVGYWEAPYAHIEQDFEKLCLIIVEDLQGLICYKVSNNVTDEYLEPYAGKYVTFGESGPVIVDPTNPTTASLSSAETIKEIRRNSFIMSSEEIGDLFFERVEPFEYEFLED